MSTLDDSVEKLDSHYRRVKVHTCFPSHLKPPLHCTQLTRLLTSSSGTAVPLFSAASVRCEPSSTAVMMPGGPEAHTWHHVHHLRLRHGPVASTLRRLAEHLPAFAARLLKSWFPGPFLPTVLIVKQQKPDWEAEFDNEIKTYQRLAPLQGSVVPVLYGTVTFEGVRALLLSDLGGRQIASVGYDVVSRETLRDMLISALRPTFDLGIYPYDANLLNCHLVDGNKIMIVDHELDEDLEEGDGEELGEQVEGQVESIMAIHWQIHKPRGPPRDPAAQRAAWEASQARNRAALRIGSAMPGRQRPGPHNAIGAAPAPE